MAAIRRSIFKCWFCWFCSISFGNSWIFGFKYMTDMACRGEGLDGGASCFSGGKGWIQSDKFQVSTTSFLSFWSGISPCQGQIHSCSWGPDRADSNSTPMGPLLRVRVLGCLRRRCSFQVPAGGEPGSGLPTVGLEAKLSLWYIWGRRTIARSLLLVRHAGQGFSSDMP